MKIHGTNQGDNFNYFNIKYQKNIACFVISSQKYFLVRLQSHFLSDGIQMYEPNSLQLKETFRDVNYLQVAQSQI